MSNLRCDTFIYCIRILVVRRATINVPTAINLVLWRLKMSEDNMFAVNWLFGLFQSLEVD